VLILTLRRDGSYVRDVRDQNSTAVLVPETVHLLTYLHMQTKRERESRDFIDTKDVTISWAVTRQRVVTCVAIQDPREQFPC
jgi:hypothetical protein